MSPGQVDFSIRGREKQYDDIGEKGGDCTIKASMLTISMGGYI